MPRPTPLRPPPTENVSATPSNRRFCHEASLETHTLLIGRLTVNDFDGRQFREIADRLCAHIKTGRKLPIMRTAAKLAAALGTTPGDGQSATVSEGLPEPGLALEWGLGPEQERE